MNNEFNEILAKLKADTAIHKAQIETNPIPYLAEAHKQLMLARKCFHDIEYALSSDFIFEYVSENAPHIRPIDYQGQDKLKIDKVKKIIDDYMRGKE